MDPSSWNDSDRKLWDNYLHLRYRQQDLGCKKGLSQNSPAFLHITNVLRHSFHDTSNDHLRIRLAFEFALARKDPFWVLQSPQKPLEVPAVIQSQMLKTMLSPEEQEVIDILANMQQLSIAQSHI